jgi:hypothetical protein
MFRRVAGKFIFSSSTLSDLVELLFWIFALRDLFIYIYAFPTSPLYSVFARPLYFFLFSFVIPARSFFLDLVGSKNGQ